MATDLPDGLELVRTTPVFDEHTVPAGLLSSHRVADGVWGRLVVSSGSLRFVFEPGDDVESSTGPPPPRLVGEGDTQVIPPALPHHLEIVGPVAFVVEFHRRD